MSIRERLSGNEAIAYAMRQINPDVMGAFPITPSTEIPQIYSRYIADGKVDTEFRAPQAARRGPPPRPGPRTRKQARRERPGLCLPPRKGQAEEGK